MAEWSSKAQRSRDEPGQEKRYLPDILPVLGKLEPYEAPKRIGTERFRLQMDRRKLVGNLTEQQKEIYEKILANHLASMGEEERSKYGLTCVMWDEKEQVFKVHFSNGKWWHYALDGTWYQATKIILKIYERKYSSTCSFLK